MFVEIISVKRTVSNIKSQYVMGININLYSNQFIFIRKRFFIQGC